MPNDAGTRIASFPGQESGCCETSGCLPMCGPCSRKIYTTPKHSFLLQNGNGISFF